MELFTGSSVQKILTEDSVMKRVSTEFVPQRLIAEQKQHCREACFALKEEFQNDFNFFYGHYRSPQSWCYGYDPESKQQSSE